jgi:hypothetical protein
LNESRTNLAINLHIQRWLRQKKAGCVWEDDLNRTRSWFELVTRCAALALALALSFALLFISAAAAFAAADGGKAVEVATRETENPGGRAFAGLITDDHCGARHEMDSGMSPAECTKMCVRNGSRYVLVKGSKTYALAGDENKLEGLAGQRATIVGALTGHTIKVFSTASTQ